MENGGTMSSYNIMFYYQISGWSQFFLDVKQEYSETFPGEQNKKQGPGQNSI